MAATPYVFPVSHQTGDGLRLHLNAIHCPSDSTHRLLTDDY